MSLVTTIAAAEPNPQDDLGDLGRFRFRSVMKLVQPVMQFGKPLLNLAQSSGVMGKGGGLLMAMGPWGWAAGAALAAGGTAAALIARQRKRQREARARRDQEAAAAAAAAAQMPSPDAQPTAMPGYDPSQVQPEQPMPYQASMPDASAAMPLPDAPPPMYAMPASEVAMPAFAEQPPQEQPPQSQPEIPEVQAVLDPEQVVQVPVSGLGADGDHAVALDWRAVAVIAGIGLGAWWLMSDNPRPRTRRR